MGRGGQGRAGCSSKRMKTQAKAAEKKNRSWQSYKTLEKTEKRTPFLETETLPRFAEAETSFLETRVGKRAA